MKEATLQAYSQRWG